MPPLDKNFLVESSTADCTHFITDNFGFVDEVVVAPLFKKKKKRIIDITIKIAKIMKIVICPFFIKNYLFPYLNKFLNGIGVMKYFKNVVFL